MFTSVLHFCPLPSPYHHITFPRMQDDLSFEWPRPQWCHSLAAGGVTYRSLWSNQIHLRWLRLTVSGAKDEFANAIGVALIKNQKRRIKQQIGRPNMASLSLARLMEDVPLCEVLFFRYPLLARNASPSRCVHLILMGRFPVRRFVSWQLWLLVVFTGHWQWERWSPVRNELTRCGT